MAASSSEQASGDGPSTELMFKATNVRAVIFPDADPNSLLRQNVFEGQCSLTLQTTATATAMLVLTSGESSLTFRILAEPTTETRSQGVAFCVLSAIQQAGDRVRLGVGLPQPHMVRAFTHIIQASVAGNPSEFIRKTDEKSAVDYFGYYAKLASQQNMMTDVVRTTIYQKAIMKNAVDFKGKLVADVGTGSGILSFFSSQAGAKHVYALEASDIAHDTAVLVKSNKCQDRITVVKGRVEELRLPEGVDRVDCLVSEPMGTLLLNERMIESYLIARDRFLKPGGKMFPSTGTIFMAPFSDNNLYYELVSSSSFWSTRDFYGVDLSSLHQTANKRHFNRPVVDAFDPSVLLCPAKEHVIDFRTATPDSLERIEMPIRFETQYVAVVHGLAFWFDVDFIGSAETVVLSTAPGKPTTHWQQIRCPVLQPMAVNPGQVIVGKFTMVANQNQSYSVELDMHIEDSPSVRATGKLDLKDPVYRAATTYSNTAGYYQQGVSGGYVPPDPEMLNKNLSAAAQPFCPPTAMGE